MRHARPPSLRYATARPRLAASIVGQLGRDVGLAESGLLRVKRDALLTPTGCPFRWPNRLEPHWHRIAFRRDLGGRAWRSDRMGAYRRERDEPQDLLF
jgi:hypothetical protein